jgi:hypothetical protein
MLAIFVCSAFRPGNGDDDKLRLHGITTATDRTIISYNADKSIAELQTTYKTADGSYSSSRIPVYRDGKLAEIFVTDNESTKAPTLFSSFDYAENGKIMRINYYMERAVHSYDSLIYNASGQVIARYFFNNTQDGSTFVNNSCQLYSWDNKGNIISVDNMGRVNKKLPFTLSSTNSYAYDNHPNAQHSIPALAYLIDMAAVNLSANNIVTETITPAVSGNSIVNKYTYTYNAQRYPTHITTTYAAGNETVTTELEWVWQ